MPATLPTPNALQANYLPSLATQQQALYEQGAFTLALPATFATADAAVLYTVPTGMRMRIARVFIEVTTAWTGGSSSAIGVSSSKTAHSTKGDLMGGASGDVLAGLTAGFRGTIGADLATDGLVVLEAADTIRFDRITSVFTAGAGIIHVNCWLLPAT